MQHISAGDLLRAEARADTPAGREVAACQERGDLVRDGIVFDVLISVVAAAVARGGYILDGFPRTLPQATAAAELAERLGLTPDAVVYLHRPSRCSCTGCWAESARADAPTTQQRSSGTGCRCSPRRPAPGCPASR